MTATVKRLINNLLSWLICIRWKPSNIIISSAVVSGICGQTRNADISLLCARGGLILTFFKILFFGASIQLTSSPVEIGTIPLELEAPKLLNVVTTGAHLLIDVSKNVKTGDLFEARNDSASKYPEGCIEAKMITKAKKAYTFSNQGILWRKGQVQLSLSRTDKIDTNLEFTMVKISSCEPIRDAEIIWINYKH